MKKTLLIFLLCAVAFLSGCSEKKSYSSYLLVVPAESWVGGADSDYNIMYGFLLDEGFISYLNIEGDDVKVNDAQALAIYQQRLDRLRQFNLGAVMVGASSPGSINFNYELRTGSTEVIMRSESFNVNF